MAGLFIVYREAPVVRYSHLWFCLLSFVGFLLGYAFITTYIGNLNEAQCALRPWFGGLAFILVVAPIFGKLWRLWRIMSNTALVSTTITTQELLIYTGIPMLAEVVLLAIWTGVGRLGPVVRAGSKDGYSIVVCTNVSLWIFLGIQMAYFLLLLIACIVLSVLVRQIASKVMWREPQWMSLAVYNISFWAVLFGLASGFLWNVYVGAFIVPSIAVLGMVTGAFLLIYIPKVYVIFFTKEGSQPAGDSVATNFSTDFKPDDLAD